MELHNSNKETLEREKLHK